MNDTPAVYEELFSRITTRPHVAVGQSSWGVGIALYFYLVGLGAGSFCTAIVLGWLGFGLAPSYVTVVGDWSWDWSQALLLWGPGVAALGASTHLVHAGKNRFLAYTAGKNPRTSWMARGFSILSTFIVVGGAATVVAVFFPQAGQDDAVLWRVLQALAALSALSLAIYPGMFLRSMPVMPAWNTVLVPALLTISAFVTGSLVLVVGATVYTVALPDNASGTEMLRALGVLAPLLILVEMAVLGVYVGRLRRGSKPEALLSVTKWLSGAWRYPFWIGIVGAALAVPFLLAVVNLGLRAEGLGLIAAVCGLIGGFLVSDGVLAIGIKESPPLVKLSQWRRQRAPSRPRDSVGECGDAT